MILYSDTASYRVTGELWIMKSALYLYSERQIRPIKKNRRTESSTN